MSPIIGSLFTGYGGLEMGVQAALGGTVAWHSEIDPAASRVLSRHWPGVPNLGDITTIDWARVPRVDILTGGFPCQDVSTAGLQAGLRPGTRSGLWSHFAYAIDQLRPALVVIENVRGLLSAGAHSDVEPCPWCVGDGEGEPALRALGAVLGDQAVRDAITEPDEAHRLTRYRAGKILGLRDNAVRYMVNTDPRIGRAEP